MPKRLLVVFLNWLKFRCYCYFKLLRPASLVIGEHIRIDFFSSVNIDKHSTLIIGDHAVIKKSRINIKNSRVSIGGCSRFTAAKINLLDSEITIGKNLIIDHTILNVSNQSVFQAGDYNMYTQESYYKTGQFLSNSEIRMGNNVNIYAHVQSNGGVLNIGSNVFLNPGTEIRCSNGITIGNNILVSYECIIFDNNTHSLDPLDRYREMELGFPNQVTQDESIKAKVKSAPISVGDDCWIGMRSIILKGTQLGKRVIVGSGSVVAGKTIGDDKKIFGNPAQVR